MPEASEWKVIIYDKLTHHTLTNECMVNLWNEYQKHIKRHTQITRDDMKKLAAHGFNQNIQLTKKWSVVINDMTDNDYQVMMYYTMPRPSLIVEVINEMQDSYQYPILMNQIDKVIVTKLADGPIKEYIKSCFNAETKIKALIKHQNGH